MKTSTQTIVLRRTLIAVAVLAAVGQARAQMSDEVRQLTTPDASVSVGVGAVSGDSKDRAQFGIFNGMREKDTYLLLDVDFVKRDAASGTWTTIVGRNLGLDNREIRVGMQKQGDWKAFGEYSEITRHSPFTVNTGMLNVGSTTPQVVAISAAGTGSDYDFKTERKGVTVGLDKWVFPGLKIEVSFKNEDKDGTRQWGRGYDCAAYVCGPSTTTALDQTKFLKNAILMIPEPFNSTIKQIDAKINWHDEKLNLVAGYYGNLYSNSNGSISPIVPNSLYGGNGTLVPALYPAVTSAIIAGGGTSLQNVLQLPMSLQPDSQAHQVYVQGNYAFTPTTKATFKYAYTHGTQDKDFASMGLGAGAPAGVSNLDGRVDTVAAQLGVTSRPIKDLSLVANISYMRREDKTPNALYNVEAKAIVPATTPASYTNINQVGVPGAVWNNNHVSNTNVIGKLEASYRLPFGFRGTAAWDYREIERLVPESRVEEALAGLGPLREKNTEDGYRLELRRSMSESLNGSVGYTNSKRRGSDWTNLSTLDPTTLPANSALNTYLINTYCGGAACYGGTLPAWAIIGVSANTPFPLSMADVNREKWKATADWTPFDKLSVQVLAEDGKDRNTTYFDPVAGGKGWRDSSSSFYSVDVSYAVSDNWKLTGYASQGQQETHVNHSTGYMADLDNRSTAVGLSLTGQLMGNLQVGAALTYINDVNKYGVAANTGTAGDRLTGLTVTQPSATNLAQAAVGLPDVTYRKTLLSLFGQYSINKTSDVRLDLAYQKSKYDDWVWGVPAALFVYGDNTSVSQKIDQNVTFVGVSYIYRFR
jgi:MtrB/PioB family decaheme-associated outer membrane protein